MTPDHTLDERVQPEVEEIAEHLLDHRPPGTELRDVWDEALSTQAEPHSPKTWLERLIL